MDPNDVIDTIVDAIDYAEIARDMQGLIKARRLLKNDLRQAIDEYVQYEVTKALEELMPAAHQMEASLFIHTPIESGD